MNTTLQVIGCGDAYASGGQLQTCFHLKTDGTNMLIDCGATSLHGLKNHGVDPDQIDTILISHLHGDHYGGIPFFLMDAAVRKRQKKLTIITPETGEARINALLQLLYPGSDKTSDLNLEYMAYEAFQPINLKGINIEAFTVVHSESALSHGFRITINDKILSYSGDTTWTDTLIPLSKDADLFICECNFFSTSTNTHMNYLELSDKLPLLSHKKILITHLSEEMLTQLHHVDLPVAKDGMRIEM